MIEAPGHVTLQKIGQGGFSVVYTAQDLKSGQTRAIKCETLDREDGMSFLPFEYKILSYLNNKVKGVVPVHSFFQTKKANILVMDYIGRDLSKLHAQQVHTFTLHTVGLIALQTISILRRLHS